MKITIIICVAIFALLFVYRTHAQYSVTRERAVALDQIPRIFEKLRASKNYPAFAAFMFGAPDRPGNDGTINLQFSMEQNRPGLDWVLLAPGNIADQNKFLEFSRARGFKPELKEGNGVRYWRIEDGDLTSICTAVIAELYGVPRGAEIGLVVMGFEWGSAPGENGATRDIIITKQR